MSEDQKVIPEAAPAPSNGVIRLADKDRRRLNNAASLLNLAKKSVQLAETNLNDVWIPIKERYALPNGIAYDAEAGEVTLTPPEAPPASKETARKSKVVRKLKAATAPKAVQGG